VDRTVRAAVADTLPGATVAAIEAPATGNTKRTAFVTLADGREPVFQSRPAGAGLATEARLAREVARRTDVPVPRVVARGTLAGVEYVLVEGAPGEDLHGRFVHLDPAGRRVVVRSMGRWLADLHGAFQFEGYGPVTLAGDWLAVADPAPDWRDWFRGHVQRALSRVLDAPGDGFADLASRVREAVDADLGDLPTDPPPGCSPGTSARGTRRSRTGG